MRTSRQAIDQSAWPSLRHARGRLLGLPFLLGAGSTGLVFGWQACLAGLMLASLASFVVYVPMTALALNGGRAIHSDAAVPPLTARAYGVLLVLWVVTIWLGAATLRFD